MLPVMEAIHRIRAALHDDEQRINYTDEEILNVLNAGLRVIRRTITDIQPEILMETMTGVLEAGQNEIRLKKRPLMILDVTAGNKVLSTSKGESNEKVFKSNAPIFGNKTRVMWQGRRQTTILPQLPNEEIFDSEQMPFDNQHKIFSPSTFVIESRNVYRSKYLDVGGHGQGGSFSVHSIVLDVAEV